MTANLSPFRLKSSSANRFGAWRTLLGQQQGGTGITAPCAFRAFLVPEFVSDAPDVHQALADVGHVASAFMALSPRSRVNGGWPAGVLRGRPGT